MNAARRKKIEEITNELVGLKVALDELQRAEQDGFDNLPESMQGGDRGQQMEAAADSLTEAAGNIDDAISNLESAVE